MRFSVWVDQSRPWSEVRALAQQAEAAGWDGLYVYDHFLPHTDDDSIDDGPVMEGWTLLTALACHTSRLRLGTLVLGNLYRHPAVVANMAATLDIVSDGRLLLGLGAGWQQNEHRAYGIDLPAPTPRLAQFEEAVQVTRSLLQERRTTFDGTYYTLVDAPCEPKPIQDPLPILIGSSGERRGIPLAARWADEWNAWTTIDSFRRKSAVLDRAAEAAGRDPAAIRRSSQAVVRILEDGATYAPGDGPELTGAPAQLIDTLGEYAEAGLDEWIVPDDCLPLEQQLELHDRFLSEVAAAHR